MYSLATKGTEPSKMDEAVVSPNASSTAAMRDIKSEVGILYRHRRRLGNALKRGFRPGPTTTSPYRDTSSVGSYGGSNKKSPLHPFSLGSSRRNKSEKSTNMNTHKDTTPACVYKPRHADPCSKQSSELACLSHPSSASDDGTTEMEPPYISATVSTMRMANTVEKELATTMIREKESSMNTSDTETRPCRPFHKGTTKTKTQDTGNVINGSPSFETLDTASRMLSEQTLGYKVIEDLTGAFGGIGVFQRAFKALQFDKRSELTSEVESNEKQDTTDNEAEPVISLDTCSQSFIDSTPREKIDTMNSELTDHSGSSNASANVKSYLFHLWSGDFTSLSAGRTNTKSKGDTSHSTSSSSSSSSTRSATSSSASRSILTGAIISSGASVRSRSSCSTHGSGTKNSLHYSNTEYSEAGSDITTSSKSSSVVSRSSFKSTSSRSTTRSTASQSTDTESVFVNRICEGVRTRVPDRVSKLAGIHGEGTMSKPDTSKGEAPNEAQESRTLNTSISSGETSSASNRSTGSQGSPPDQQLVYKISKRSLYKANLGFSTPQASESNFEVIARTSSMDTESTSSTKDSEPSTSSIAEIAPTNILQSMPSRISAQPEIDGRAIELSWDSV